MKRRILTYFVAPLVYLQMTLCLPVETEAAEQHVYRMALSNRRQASTVYINGFPFRISNGTNSFTATSVIEPYIFSGENILTIQCSDPATNIVANDPSLVRIKLEYGDESPLARQSVFTLERQHLLVENQPVESISFTSTNMDMRLRSDLRFGAMRAEINRETRSSSYRTLTSAPPHTIEIRERLPLSLLPSLPWIGQPPQVEESDRAALRTLVQSIHAAISSGNYPQLLQHARVKNQRMAQAASQTLAEREAASQVFFENVRSEPGFTLFPLDPATLEFRTYPDANLIQVQSRDDAPIQATSTNLRFKLPIFASKIAGTWVWVD